MFVMLFLGFGVVTVTPLLGAFEPLSHNHEGVAIIAGTLFAAVLLGVVQEIFRLSTLSLCLMALLSIGVVIGFATNHAVAGMLSTIAGVAYVPAFIVAARGVVALGRARSESLVDRIDRLSLLSGIAALHATTAIWTGFAPRPLSLFVAIWLPLIVLVGRWHAHRVLARAERRELRGIDLGLGDDRLTEPLPQMSYREAPAETLLVHGDFLATGRELKRGLYGDAFAFALCVLALAVRLLYSHG